MTLTEWELNLKARHSKPCVNTRHERHERHERCSEETKTCKSWRTQQEDACCLGNCIFVNVFFDVLAKLLQWLVGLGSGESTFRRRNPVAPSLCCRHLLRLFATPRRPHDTTFWNVESQQKWGKNMENWKKPSKSVLILNFCHYVWMIPNVCHYVRLCRTLCHIDSHIADIVQTLKVLCCQNGL